MAVRACQVVAAGTGVRIEIEEALVLALQCPQQRAQRHMLVHVGEISSVKAVAIFHRAWRQPAVQNFRPRPLPSLLRAARARCRWRPWAGAWSQVSPAVSTWLWTWRQPVYARDAPQYG